MVDEEKLILKNERVRVTQSKGDKRSNSSLYVDVESYI